MSKSAPEMVKEAGFDSMVEFSEFTDIPRDKLYRWHKDNVTLFELVILGAEAKREKNNS